MKVQLKFLVIGIIVLTATFISCKNNGDTSADSTTTVKQDKDNIQSSFDGIATNLTQLKDGSFYQAGIEFLNVKNGVALNSDWADQIGSGLGDVIDGDNLISNNRFNYSLLAGKYTWNPSSKKWIKSTNNTFIATFPSTNTSATNNCEFGISSYTDKSVVIEGKNGYLPTATNAYLKKDNVQIMSLYSVPAIIHRDFLPMPAFNYILNQSLHLFHLPVKLIQNTVSAFQL